jgi:DNA polymerase III delta prime subunit
MQADINQIELEQYDTIIAFEIIEHMDNGLEVLEKLKKHCKRLLFTTPHTEPKGFWGEHHKLHGLNESHFKGFDFEYTNEFGLITQYMIPVSPTNQFNLLMGKWDKEKILCCLPTKGRYFTTLPLVIEAIANQTKKPDKLIIFDEADNMTDKALPIISMLMDKYHETTRFVFTCNVSSKIIESIQSRCKILRFSRLHTDFISKRLGDICKLEKVKSNKTALEDIAVISNGDLRSAINLLQLTNDRFGKITEENVSITCDKPSAVLIKNIIIDCINKKLSEAITGAFTLKSKGFTGVDIIYNSFNVLKLNICNDISESNKIKILTVISEYMYSISKSMDTDVQLTSFLIELSNI